MIELMLSGVTGALAVALLHVQRRSKLLRHRAALKQFKYSSPKIIENEKLFSAELVKEKLNPHDFSHFWYPLCFSTHLPNDKPLGIKILNESLVIYRDEMNQPVVAADKCPHRHASLSLGKLDGKGKLECLYHGWQFGSEGKCVTIPSLSPEKCSRYCDAASLKTKLVHEELGIVWIWMGPSELAHTSTIPRTLFTDGYYYQPKAKTYDFVTDVPARFDLLVENSLDYTHVDFTHLATFGSKKGRSWCDQHQLKDGKHAHLHPDAVTVQFSQPESTSKDKQQPFMITFVPPGFVQLESKFFSQTIATIPISTTETRFLARFYMNTATSWLYDYYPGYDSSTQKLGMKIIEEDLALLKSIQNSLRPDDSTSGIIVPSDILMRRFGQWKQKAVM